MSEVYKLINPVKYFNDFIFYNSRPDGRKFRDQRGMVLQVDVINTADASAYVKCGNTTVICGIKLELATPKPEEPEYGYLITNVELPPLCSAKCKPGPPSDYAQVISNLVKETIFSSSCINFKDLCIVPEKLAWVLYCDIVCLNNDGSLLDACLISLIATLKTLKLPLVTYEMETEEIKVDIESLTPLPVNGLPVAMSFVIYNHIQSDTLLADPTAFEEDMCGGSGANLIICVNEDYLCGVHKFGGSKLTVETQETAISICKEKSTLIKKLIETSIKNKKYKLWFIVKMLCTLAGLLQQLTIQHGS